MKNLIPKTILYAFILNIFLTGTSYGSVECQKPQINGVTKTIESLNAEEFYTLIAKQDLAKIKTCYAKTYFKMIDDLMFLENITNPAQANRLDLIQDILIFHNSNKTQNSDMIIAHIYLGTLFNPDINYAKSVFASNLIDINLQIQEFPVVCMAVQGFRGFTMSGDDDEEESLEFIEKVIEIGVNPYTKCDKTTLHERVIKLKAQISKIQ